MSTIALHAQTQHHRFFRHVTASIGAWFAGRPGVPSAGPGAGDDALKVRELANRYAETDPGFAADLYAAAARHEAMADA